MYHPQPSLVGERGERTWEHVNLGVHELGIAWKGTPQRQPGENPEVWRGVLIVMTVLIFRNKWWCIRNRGMFSIWYTYVSDMNWIVCVWYRMKTPWMNLKKSSKTSEGLLVNCYHHMLTVVANMFPPLLRFCFDSAPQPKKKLSVNLDSLSLKKSSQKEWWSWIRDLHCCTINETQ